MAWEQGLWLFLKIQHYLMEQSRVILDPLTQYTDLEIWEVKLLQNLL